MRSDDQGSHGGSYQADSGLPRTINQPPAQVNLGQPGTEETALAQNDPAGSADLLAACAVVAEAEGLLMEGFRLLFNTGGYAGQEVFHVHAHVLGGEPLGPMLALR